MLRTDSQKIAHLLRRFGLGASEAELQYYGSNGLSGAIDKLLNYEKVDEGFDLDIQAFYTGKNNNKLKIEGAQGWWLLRMITTRRPLQEKMTLFWHDHFATSNDKVSSPDLMIVQNEILRRNATGKFHDLLLNVSKDPAMLVWLDNQYNVKGHPNENFAREVMELFTLGIGHYTEKDVQEAARAFTGWTFRSALRKGPKKKQPPKNDQFVDNSSQHDAGMKEVLQNRGPFDGDDVIAILCGNPRTAEYITEKIWNWFVYPSPDPGVLKPLASAFYKSNLDIKVLLRAIMESLEFYSDRAYRAVYKTPVDFVIAPLRQLGFGAQPVSTEALRQELRPVTAARIATKGQGMNLMYPPDVAGWDGGPAWVSTGTMVERMHWAQMLFGDITLSAKQGNRVFSIGVNAWPLFAKDPSPQAVVRRLLSLFDADLPASKVAALARAVPASVDRENANEVAATVSQLIFASPEFQFL